MVVLLFPFYWMALTAIKPNNQLIDMDTYNPFFVVHPTFDHIYALLFQTSYPRWLWNTMFISVAATAVSLFASVLASYAIVRIRYRGANWVGAAIFLAYLVATPRSCSFRSPTIIQAYGLFDSPFALILAYPTIPDPVLDLAPHGLFQDHPLRARGMRAHRWGQPLADPGEDRPAARGAGADLGRHLLSDAVLERVHLRADVPVLDAEQDSAGRNRVRVRRWRRLQMGAR